MPLSQLFWNFVDGIKFKMSEYLKISTLNNQYLVFFVYSGVSSSTDVPVTYCDTVFSRLDTIALKHKDRKCKESTPTLCKKGHVCSMSYKYKDRRKKMG